MGDIVASVARNSIIRSRAIREAEEWVRGHIWALEDAAIVELQALYADSYQRMAAALFNVFQRTAGSTWNASDLAYRQRTEDLLVQIASEMERLSNAAMEQTLGAAARAYQGGYYGRAWVLEQGLRLQSQYAALLPMDAIRAALLAPYAGLDFTGRFIDARDDFLRRIRRAIVQSQIEGDGIYQAQQRLARELGINISRRTRDANSGYFARVEMIARTEILRASNLGALAVYEANQDTLQGWRWLATKDERTCPICGALDGQVFKFGAGHSPPPAHPRCRCSAVPVLINERLAAKITGPRKTYRDWAAERGVTIQMDGGVLAFRAKAPPRSAGARQVAGLYQ